VTLVESASLMDGELRGVKWRAHEGNVTALHAKGSAGRTLLSGGSDGAVRRWDLDQLPVDGSRQPMRDLGLHACACAGGNGFVVQHDESVTHLAHHGDQAASASRDGARPSDAAQLPRTEKEAVLCAAAAGDPSKKRPGEAWHR
jgi:WD40 repeat protein